MRLRPADTRSVTLLNLRSRAALFTATAASPLLLHGCGAQSCTLVGCTDEPLTLIQLSPNWMPLEPAVYTLTFKLNGLGFTARCSATEADQSCGPVDGTSASFDVSVFVTTNNQIRINMSVRDSPGYPDDFRVEVSVEGSLVVEESGVFVKPSPVQASSICRSPGLVTTRSTNARYGRSFVAPSRHRRHTWSQRPRTQNTRPVACRASACPSTLGRRGAHRCPSTMATADGVPILFTRPVARRTRRTPRPRKPGQRLASGLRLLRVVV